jgi:hypothetical protein
MLGGFEPYNIVPLKALLLSWDIFLFKLYSFWAKTKQGTEIAKDKNMTKIINFLV